VARVLDLVEPGGVRRDEQLGRCAGREEILRKRREGSDRRVLVARVLRARVFHAVERATERRS
jgi:hypothetical protein